jgi:hypothetical protein
VQKIEHINGFEKNAYFSPKICEIFEISGHSIDPENLLWGILKHLTP